MGLKLRESLPDETTILNFRHLLEEHELGKGVFEEIKGHLESQRLRLRNHRVRPIAQRFPSLLPIDCGQANTA